MKLTSEQLSRISDLKVDLRDIASQLSYLSQRTHSIDLGDAESEILDVLRILENVQVSSFAKGS